MRGKGDDGRSLEERVVATLFQRKERKKAKSPRRWHSEGAVIRGFGKKKTNNKE